MLGEAGLADRPRTPHRSPRATPRAYQSAESCYHGPITKQGCSHGRWLAVEAARSMVVSGAPLTATYHRVRRRKSHNVAIVALACELVVMVWRLLAHRERYRYAQTQRIRAKLRRVKPGIGPAKVGCVPSRIEPQLPGGALAEDAVDDTDVEVRARGSDYRITSGAPSAMACGRRDPAIETLLEHPGHVGPPVDLSTACRDFDSGLRVTE